jgi:hypothetical protein
MKSRFSFGRAAALLALAACGTEDEAGSGSLVLTLSGEEAAQTGFPVPGVPELQFADGWSVKFDKYLVGVGNVRVAGADGASALEDRGTVVVDLTAGEQEIFRFDGLGARRWERFGYDILVPVASTRAVGAVADADLRRMMDGGFNYWIEGSATRAGETVRFSWGLSSPTLNDDCINSADDSPGVVVRNNAAAAYQITLHLDHLFYDRLGAHDGVKMRFAAIAAVAGEDGAVEWGELASQRLASLKDADGQSLLDERGELLVYDPESVQLADADLQSYLLAASISQGRFNGEGICVNRTMM